MHVCIVEDELETLHVIARSTCDEAILNLPQIGGHL